MNEAVFGIEQSDIATDAVAQFIAVRGFPQRIPCADIRPIESGLHDGCQSGLLHHRIINRDFGRFCELHFAKAHGSEIHRMVRERFASRVGNLGCKGCNLGKHRIGPEHEIARVPQTVLRNELASFHNVGLF